MLWTWYVLTFMMLHTEQEYKSYGKTMFRAMASRGQKDHYNLAQTLVQQPTHTPAPEAHSPSSYKSMPELDPRQTTSFTSSVHTTQNICY